MFSELRKLLRENVREYGMYIALVVIITFFTIVTGGSFISSGNISNLMNQSGYIIVLAVGMTLVIVIRHIDLSVGFLSGFLGAIAAISMVSWHLPWYLSILLVLALGVLAGTIVAFLVANLGIPAFVATLAGWLIYRGALGMVTVGTGTIIIPDATFNAICNGFLPDIFPKLQLFGGRHKLTLILGLLAIVWLVWRQVADRNNKRSYGFEVLQTNFFVIKLVFMALILGLITWVFAGGNGLSYTIVIILVVVFVFDFLATRTVLGRHIFAVGGNPEAAELSGVSVKKITYIVFGMMGLLTAVAGVMFASRSKSASPTAGTLFELDAIAAAYIGGVSAAGGVGKITGSLVGGLVYMSLTNGMLLMGTDISIQYIVRGAVLALAVIFDVMTRRAKA